MGNDDDSRTRKEGLVFWFYGSDISAIYPLGFVVRGVWDVAIGSKQLH